MAFIARGCGRDPYIQHERAARVLYTGSRPHPSAINAMQHERIRTINWFIVHLNLN